MSEELIRVEVVAAVHNRRDITLQCLRSLSKINHEGLDVHVVIVDDGSSDGTGEAIREEFPEVEIVEGSGDLWYTEGTNTGARAALKHGPKYLLLINDDQVFDENAIKYMVETAEANERSVVGSLLLLWDTPHKLFQTSPVWQTLGGGWRHWTKQTVWTIPDRPWKVDLIVGNCVLVPAAAIKEEGLMNSRRYPNFGDAEFTPRLKRKGWNLLIDPRARVFCQPNTMPRALRSLDGKTMFNRLFVDLHYPQSLRRRFYSYMDGAPSRTAGAVAFAAFIVRWFAGKNIESGWAENQVEKPLAETMAHAIVGKS